MNPVLILTRNCLELTKKCVKSVREQDIPTKICIFDNGSTDGTYDWVNSVADRFRILWNCSSVNEGVSKAWNNSLNYLFLHLNYEHVLVVNNDAILPRHAYFRLLSYNVPFVTGTETQDLFDIGPMAVSEDKPLGDGPDFSCFLIRREAWEMIGPFNESMKIYASDCDYDIRARRLGIQLYRAPVLYYHERSSTLKKASPEDQEAIHKQAELDRAAFKAIYGIEPGEPGYEKLFPHSKIWNPTEE